MVLLATILCAPQGRTQPPTPRSDAQGFAPPDQNLLAPLLLLASSGDAQAALEIFEQIHDLDRKLILHPTLSAELENVIDKLPAPEVIPVEMPSLYSSRDIPWHSAPPDVHYLAVDGRPLGANYIYGLAEESAPLQQPGRFGAVLRVIPQARDSGLTAASAIAKFKGLLYISGRLDPDRGMAAVLGFEREIYGSLAPPWDEPPGVFNEHDRAALARLKRDLPATAQRIVHYLDIHNVLDEFSDASGPWVLFNFDAEVREDALAPFPHLQTFWRQIAGHVEAQTIVRDERGRRWLVTGLHRGHITIAFILRRGMLTPMDAAMKPAGLPLPIEQIRAGRFDTESTVSTRNLRMEFGLSGIRFLTTYENRDGAIRFDAHMADVPKLIAPRIFQPLTMLLAGEFLETIAQGNAGRGVTQSFIAAPGPRGGTMLSGSISAELRNAPTLALLARMAAAFAPDNIDQVREEQRRLTAEFFDAFDSDYRRACPLLLGTVGAHAPTPPE